MQNADLDQCTRQAQAIHAFRHGRPRNLYKLYALGKPPLVSFLVRDLYIYLPRSDNRRSREVIILDLHQWKLRSLSSDGREQIFAISASDDIVASGKNIECSL